MALPDYYALLGVAETASEDEIRKAHRAKLLTVHPDLNPGNAAAEELAKRLGEARQVLLDPTARRLYDEIRRRTAGQADEAGLDIGDVIRLFESATGLRVEDMAEALADKFRHHLQGFLRAQKGK